MPSAAQIVHNPTSPTNSYIDIPAHRNLNVPIENESNGKCEKLI